MSILNCHEDIIEYMHDYLDEDITPENEEALRSHLQTCSECRDYFHEMKKAVALVQSTSHIRCRMILQKGNGSIAKGKETGRGKTLV